MGILAMMGYYIGTFETMVWSNQCIPFDKAGILIADRRSEEARSFAYDR